MKQMPVITTNECDDRKRTMQDKPTSIQSFGNKLLVILYLIYAVKDLLSK